MDIILSLFLLAIVFVIGYAVLLQWRKRDPRNLDPRSATMVFGGQMTCTKVPNNCINVCLYMEELPPREALAEWIQQHLVEGYLEFRAVPKKVWHGLAWEEVPTNAGDRIFELAVDGDIEVHAALERLVRRNITNYPKGLWEIHCIRNIGSGSSLLLLRLEHCIGDGMAIAKVFSNLFTDESGRPLQPKFNGPRSPLLHSKRGYITDALAKAWDALTSLWHIQTIILGQYDSPTPFCRAPGPFPVFNPVQSIIRVPPHSLGTVQRVKDKAGCTVNDVVFACLAGALRRYLESQGVPPDDLILRALVAVAFPSDLPPQKLANTWTFVSVPVPVGVATAEGRLGRSVDEWNAVKRSSVAALVMAVTSFLTTTVPLALIRYAATSVMVRHSLVASNVQGFPGTVYICGLPIHELRMVYVNLVPQFSLVSYNGNMYTTFIIDESLVPSGGLLADFYLQELQALVDHYADQ